MILTARDRPPMDRRSPRRGQSSGGVDQAHPRTLARGIVDNLPFLPRTRNDATTVYDRTPYFSHSRFIPPAQGQVDWTRAGPVRPEMGMRNAVYRPEQGSSNSRFPYIAASSTGGLHTVTPSAISRTAPRYVQTVQMQPARQNRLSPNRYHGQTYSATTVVQGGS